MRPVCPDCHCSIKLKVPERILIESGLTAVKEQCPICTRYVLIGLGPVDDVPPMPLNFMALTDTQQELFVAFTEAWQGLLAERIDPRRIIASMED